MELREKERIEENYNQTTTELMKSESYAPAKPLAHLKKFLQFDGSLRWSGGSGVELGGHLASMMPGPVCERTSAIKDARSRNLNILFLFWLVRSSWNYVECRTMTGDD